MYQQIVDNLNLYLDSDDRTSSPQLAEDMAAYARACKEVNERLRRCNDLLARGLRAEAIHFAEAEPNLLQAISALDFSRRKELDEIAAMYELSRPPGLLTEAAIALNEAYAEHAPIEHLFIRLRRLALAHAPLLPRLHVLRQLALEEPGQSHRSEDIRAHEKAWFAECPAAAERAVAANDRRVLEEMIGELDSETLFETPPPRLRGDLIRQFQQVAQHELWDLANQMSAAHSAENLDIARSLRTRWDTIYAKLDGAADASAVQLARRVARWIDERDAAGTREVARQQAVDELKAAVFDPNVTLDELEFLGRGVARDLGAIPEAFEPQFRARLLFLRSQVKRRYVVRGAAAAAGVLVLVLMAVWFVRSQWRVTRVANTASELSQLIVNNQFVSARAKIDALTPEIAKAPPVVAQIRKVEEVESKERERTTAFESALKAISEQPPDQPTPDDAIKAVRSLAKKEKEREAVDTVLAAREQQRTAERVAREEKYRLQLDDFGAEIAKLETNAKTFLPEEFPAARLTKLEMDLTGLVQQQQKVKSDSHGRTKELQKRATAIKELLRWRTEEVHLQQELTQSQPLRDQFAAYVQGLTRLANGSPDAAVAARRRPVLDEAAIWKAIAVWNQKATEFAKQPMPAKTLEAKRRGAECQEFLKANPSFPDVARVTDYMGHLEAIGSQPGADEEINSVLDDFLVSNLTMVKTDAGERYYTKEPLDLEKLKGVMKTIEYFIDFDRLTKRKLLDLTALKSVDEAPQSTFAKAAKRILAGSKPSTWDADILGLLQSLRDDKEIDPILRTTLILRFAKSAARASTPLAHVMQTDFRLDALDVVDLNVHWMDPAKELKQAREVADEAINHLSKPKELLKKVEQRRNDIELAVTVRCVPVGWLKQREGGNFTFVPFADVPLMTLERTDLQVALPSTGPAAVWHLIGRCERGSVSLNSNFHCADGRPVFARLAMPKAKP